MKSMFSPVIVIAAFNRQRSLKRILSSLNNTFCPNGTKLIISIDNNGLNQDVADIAYRYNWAFGEKEVIYHKEHLGLRKHILMCGDLTYKYNSVIILEDDLYVSPYFYSYAQKALQYYVDSDKIAGISLYNLPYTEVIKLPFTPLKDNSSVYFMQIPSSLGQVWNKSQWEGFKTWYDNNPDLFQVSGLPYIPKQRWPESSWKKYFYAYLIEFNKFFVYPIVSLTTNFNDPGTNIISHSFKGQVEIMSSDLPIKFIDLEKALNVYDAYSEILPDRLNVFSDILKDYNYEIDIYGKKEIFNKDYVLTSKPCINPIISFERSMKPHELNIIFNNIGKGISLTHKKNILFYPKTVAELKSTNSMKYFIPEYNYYFTNVFDSNILIKILKFRLLIKIKSYLKKYTIRLFKK